MKTSDKMLRDLTSFSDEFMTSLLDFYSSKKFASVTILSWSETLDLLKNQPSISTEEILATKDLDPSILVAKTAEVAEMSKPMRHGKHHKKAKHAKHHKKDKEKDHKGHRKEKKEKKLSKGEKEVRQVREHVVDEPGQGPLEERAAENRVSICKFLFENVSHLLNRDPVHACHPPSYSLPLFVFCACI